MPRPSRSCGNCSSPQIANVTEFRVAVGGKAVAWKRDDADPFTVRVQMPDGTKKVEITFDLLLAAGAEGGAPLDDILSLSTLDELDAYAEGAAAGADFPAFLRIAREERLDALGRGPGGLLSFGAYHGPDGALFAAGAQWRGEAAPGRTLLLHAEQGFGDTLQFCRYATLAAGRGLRVVMEVPRPLLRLLRGVRGVDHIVVRGDSIRYSSRRYHHYPRVAIVVTDATRSAYA